MLQRTRKSSGDWDLGTVVMSDCGTVFVTVEVSTGIENRGTVFVTTKVFVGIEYLLYSVSKTWSDKCDPFRMFVRNGSHLSGTVSVELKYQLIFE